MDRRRLKNVIIVILVFLNAFLLGSLAMQIHAEQTTHRRLEQQLILLLSADGMTMQPGTLPREAPPAALSMGRDAARKQEAAAFFLGEDIYREEQSGAVFYAGANGTALFHEDGSFEISGALAVAEVEAACRKFCRRFSYGEPTFLMDITNSGKGSAAGMYDRRRIVGGGVTFTVEEGALTKVSGTLLPENGTPAAADTGMLSAAAALTEFQKNRRETGAVVSAVTEVELCYRLQSSAATPVLMVPVWCIVTDTSMYYVNCATGAVTMD